MPIVKLDSGFNIEVEDLYLECILFEVHRSTDFTKTMAGTEYTATSLAAVIGMICCNALSGSERSCFGLSGSCWRSLQMRYRIVSTMIYVSLDDS